MPTHQKPTREQDRGEDRTGRGSRSNEQQANGKRATRKTASPQPGAHAHAAAAELFMFTRAGTSPEQWRPRGAIR